MEWDQILYSLAQRHWEFLAVALILGLIGEVVKKLKGKLISNKRLSDLFHGTMRLHPVAAGGLVGLSGLLAAPEGTNAVLYFGLSGVLSAWAYPFANKLVAAIARKFGIKPAIDGSIPPEPPRDSGGV
jgi:hypothetical protein